MRRGRDRTVRGTGPAAVLTVGTILRGWALSGQGAADEGVELMRQGLAARREQGIELARPWYLALLASGHLELDQVDEGLSVLEEAASLSDAGFYAPELHRLRGTLLLKQSGLDAAEAAAACCQEALDLAGRQGTRAWALRAGTSLAGLWRRQGRRRAAHDLLAPLYDWFSEGLDTPDLQDARTLLGQLA